MKRRILLSSITALGLVLAVGAYRLGRAMAFGIPISSTLTYSGTVLNGGVPVTGSHLIVLNLFVTGSPTPLVCQPTATTVQLANGVFSLPLDTSCVTAVHTYQNLSISVSVDGTTVTTVPLSAAPYVVEADTASNFSPDGGLAAALAANARGTYTVWGQATCPASNPVLQTGYLGAYGGGNSASGTPMCINQSFAAPFWSGGNFAYTVRSKTTTGAANDTSQYMVAGSMACAVCSGFGYTLWGTTTCGPGDTAVYSGHAGGMFSNGASGSMAGTVCFNDSNAAVVWGDWGNNMEVTRAAEAAGNPYAQLLQGPGELTCVVCI